MTPYYSRSIGGFFSSFQRHVGGYMQFEIEYTNLVLAKRQECSAAGWEVERHPSHWLREQIGEACYATVRQPGVELATS